MYFLDTKIQDHKIMTVGLTRVFGIGFKSSDKICKKLGFSRNLKVNQLSKSHIVSLRRIFNYDFKSKVSNELRKLQSFRLQKLITIKCYRGIRKVRGLPVRGQRTHTNAKTARRKV